MEKHQQKQNQMQVSLFLSNNQFRFYIFKRDVIPTNNSFMHVDVTSPNTLTSSLISCVMAESKSRFATLSEEDLNLLLDDKDAKSTKRATKSALKVFHQHLKGKKKQMNLKRKIRLRTC